MCYLLRLFYGYQNGVYSNYLAFRIFDLLFLPLSALKFSTIATAMLENLALIPTKIAYLNSPKS